MACVRRSNPISGAYIDYMATVLMGESWYLFIKFDVVVQNIKPANCGYWLIIKEWWGDTDSGYSP